MLIILFACQVFLHLKTLLGLGGSEAYCCKFPQAKLAVLNSHFCLFVFVVAVFVIVFGDIIGFVSHLFAHDFTIYVQTKPSKSGTKFSYILVSIGK